MDYQRKLMISSSILGGLIVLFLIGSIIGAVGVAPEGKILFPEFKGGSVVSIKVTDKNGSLTVSKESDETWRIHYNENTFEPNQLTVGMLIKNLSDLRQTNEITANPEAWSNFNVDETDAVRYVVTEADGTVSVDAYFGKRGPTSFSQYVRCAGSDTVLQTDYNIEQTAALKDWVELRLFPDTIKIEEVSEISIQSRVAFFQGDSGIDAKPNTIALTIIPTGDIVDEKPVWQIKGYANIPLSYDKIVSYINMLNGFAGRDIVADPQSADISPDDRPLGSVTIRLKNGAADTLFLLTAVPGDDQLYYVTNQNRKYVYVQEDWTIRNLIKGAEGFVDEAALLLQP